MPPPQLGMPLYQVRKLQHASLQRLYYALVPLQALEEQHTRRGLLVDLPTAVRPDAAPSLPDLPPYLAAAAATSPAAPTSAPASRGARNALQFVIDRCHARLPWIRWAAGAAGWRLEVCRTPACGRTLGKASIRRWAAVAGQ